MKKSLIAVVFLVVASQIKVEAVSKMITLDPYNYIFQDEIHKTFLALNTQNNLGFVPYKRNVAIINLDSGYYVFISSITLFAVKGNVPGYRGREDYPLVLTVIQKFGDDNPMIGDDTDGSFDFNRIITCFYEHKYGLETAYPDKPQLVTHLNTTFGMWFATAQVQEKTGGMSIGIWGFLEAICRERSKPVTAVVKVVQQSTYTFGEVDYEITKQMILTSNQSSQALCEFSDSLTDYVSVAPAEEVSVTKTLQWVMNAANSPRVLKLPYGGRSYNFYLRIIWNQFVLRFSVDTESGVEKDIRFVFLPFTLLIFNEQRNFALFFHKRSFVLINLKTVLAFVGRFNLLMRISGSFEQSAKLVRLTYSERYLAALNEVKLLLAAPPTQTVSLTAIAAAIKNGRLEEIDQIVGAANAYSIRLYFLNIFTFFTGKLSDIIHMVIDYKQSSIATIFAKFLSIIAATGQHWVLFLSNFFSINISKHIEIAGR